MKPRAREWTGLSIILNIRWQETQNKGSRGASSVWAMWWVQLLLPRKLCTSRSISQIWICPLQCLDPNSMVACLAWHKTDTEATNNCFTNTNLVVQHPHFRPSVPGRYCDTWKPHVLFSSHGLRAEKIKQTMKSAYEFQHSAICLKNTSITWNWQRKLTTTWP